MSDATALSIPPRLPAAAYCGELLKLIRYWSGSHSTDLLDAAATGTAYLLDRPEPRVW